MFLEGFSSVTNALERPCSPTFCAMCLSSIVDLLPRHPARPIAYSSAEDGPRSVCTAITVKRRVTSWAVWGTRRIRVMASLLLSASAIRPNRRSMGPVFAELAGSSIDAAVEWPLPCRDHPATLAVGEALVTTWHVPCLSGIGSDTAAAQ